MQPRFIIPFGLPVIALCVSVIVLAGPTETPNSPASALSAPSAVNTPQSFDAWWASDPACERMALVAHDTAENAYHAGYQAAQRRGTNKTIIPWIEVPVPSRDVSSYPGATSGMRALDHALSGLELWSQVTDTALVTTKADAIEGLYPGLAASSMQIIGGIKTSTLLPGVDPYDPQSWDFADPTAWQRIAQAAQRIAALTGRRIVLLENEGALWHYHTGERTIDVGRLLSALAPIRESGLEIWWNLPSIQENTTTFPHRRMRTAELTAAIALAVPDSVFLGGYTMSPGWRLTGRLGDRALMLRLVGRDRLYERLLLTSGDDPRRYSLEAAIVETWRLPRGPIIVYSGATDWLPTAEQFSALACNRSE